MLAERVEQWTTKWIQQGMQQGEFNLLHRQLTKRFGPLSLEVQNRLLNATTEQLECWAERVLDAQTPEEVFDNE